MNPPPIGPMNDRQKRLEAVRRAVADVDLPLRRYFRQLLDVRPHLVTTEMFADLQSSADDLAEAIRRSMQDIYDVLEHLSQEADPADRMRSTERRIEERLRQFEQRLAQRPVIDSSGPAPADPAAS